MGVQFSMDGYEKLGHNLSVCLSPSVNAKPFGMQPLLLMPG